MKFHLHLRLFLIISFSIFKLTAQETLISSGEYWYYYDEGSLTNDWYQKINLNRKWKKGITPIGYGDSKIVTSISYGNDSENKHPAKYFVKKFNLNISNKFLAYGLQVKRDDGIIIYINGKEVFRNNLPLIVITGKTFATNRIDGRKESEILFTALDTKLFNKGVNTIAVSVHQSDSDSSDCIFDFELFGYTDPKMLSKVITNQSDKNDKLENQIKVLNNTLLIEKVSLQLEIEENRVENYKLVVAIISFLLIILLIVLAVFLNNYKTTQRKSDKRIAELNSTINENNKELMTLNAKLLFDKQYLKEIKADLRGIETNSEQVVKNIIHDINKALENDKEWQSLEKHFNELYNGFYDLLEKKHPSLTDVELRHCMVIKLHLQTKEVAKLFHIDPRSVQTARYRIKKKMNLEENIDLRDYLLKL